MARRRSARHARPTGRGALAAAQVALEADVARLRASGYADQLELVRLATLVDALVGQVQRLSLELAELRRELHAARTTPAAPDPAVEVLVAQVSDLRATIAAQQTLLADLTRRVLDLTARLEALVVVPPAPAAPAPWTPTAPPAYPVAATPHGPAAGPVAAAAPSPAAAHVDLAGPGQVVSARGAPPVADDALDDETVQRLRLIRETYGR